jgi:hypothetical protein
MKRKRKKELKNGSNFLNIGGMGTEEVDCSYFYRLVLYVE